jgi:hypothetical protein
LKKLSNKLQPYHDYEVVRTIDEILESGEKSARVIVHVLLFAEFQFGTSIPGKTYREREDGKNSKWEVDVIIFGEIYRILLNIYASDESLSLINQDMLMLPHLEKELKMLSPWLEIVDAGKTNRREMRSEDEVNQLLHLMSLTERNIANIYTHKMENSLAEKHLELALTHAKRCGSTLLHKEHKTTLLYLTYRAYYRLRTQEYRMTEAVVFAQDAYNCVAEAYSPVHPEVYYYIFICKYICIYLYIYIFIFEYI